MEAGEPEVGAWAEAYRWYCEGGYVAAEHVKHDETQMAPWEQGLYRAMRVGQYRERTWVTCRQWAGRFVRFLEERGGAGGDGGDGGDGGGAGGVTCRKRWSGSGRGRAKAGHGHGSGR